MCTVHVIFEQMECETVSQFCTYVFETVAARMSLMSCVVQTHADTPRLMLNCCLAGKQTSSIRAISVFLFLHANHPNHSLPLISFRIPNAASCQKLCLLFLHLKPWLSGLLLSCIFWSPWVTMPLFTSAAFTLFILSFSVYHLSVILPY